MRYGDYDHREKPRQKQQTILNKVLPKAFFKETTIGDLLKLELIYLTYRLFIWIKPNKTLILEAREQLATQLLIDTGNT